MRSLLGILVVLAAACGDDGNVNQLPDAPEFMDAPNNVDAPTSGVVTLTITRGTAPVANVQVYFQNPDSSLVSSTTTDANGVASATMGIGGFVTAIDPFPRIVVPEGVATNNDLRTFAGVKPGDQLKLHQRDDLTVNFTLVFTADGAVDTYELYVPCSDVSIPVNDSDGSGGSGGPGGQLSLTGCGTTTDFTVVGRDINGVEIKSWHKPNVAFTEGGTLDLTAEVFTNTADVSFNFQSVPANIGSIDVQQFLATPAGTIFNTSDAILITSGTGMSVSPRKRPVIAAPVIPLQITASRSNGGPVSTQTVLEWGPTTATYTLVMGNLLNPTILVQDLATQPTFNIDAHSVEWTVTAGGKLPDLATTRASFDRNKGAENWNWEIASPLTAAVSTSVTYPVLPAGVDSRFNAVAGDNVNVNDMTTAIVPGGYDAIRADVLALGSPLGVVTGATGQVVFQEIRRGGTLRKPQPASRVLFPTAVKRR